MRLYSAAESEWQQKFNGVELAPFHSRALALVIDWLILISGCLILIALLVSSQHFQFRLEPKASGSSLRTHVNFLTFVVRRGDTYLGFAGWMAYLVGVVVPAVYFATLLWSGDGQTPGKRLMGVRVISLFHPHLTYWRCLERAMGYGAATLAGGFGFAQYFLHPHRRCVQDRVAETIVVSEKDYRRICRGSR